MALPERTHEQRTAALEKAAAARRVRAELKELLKTGSLTLPKLFARADEDELVAGMKVYSLVAAAPGIGKVRPRLCGPGFGPARGGAGAESPRRPP